MLKLLLCTSLFVSIHAGSLKKAERYYKLNNTKKAMKYYKKACDEGVSEGCDKYNELQSPITKAFTLISQSRGEEAMPYLKQACQEGFKRACTMYESATGKTVRIEEPSKNDFQIIVDYIVEEEMNDANKHSDNTSKEHKQYEVRKKAIEIALKYTWGKPILNNIRYDKENNHYLADLKFDRKKNFSKKVTIKVPKAKEKEFIKNFSSLNPEATFTVEKGRVTLRDVNLIYLEELYSLQF